MLSSRIIGKFATHQNAVFNTRLGKNSHDWQKCAAWLETA
jgi:hypothetical protein